MFLAYLFDLSCHVLIGFLLWKVRLQRSDPFPYPSTLSLHLLTSYVMIFGSLDICLDSYDSVTTFHN